MYCYNYKDLQASTKTQKGKEYIEKIREIYEQKFQDKPITVLSHAYAKLYYQTGNRQKYQDGYFDRRQRLELLQILAVSDDSYLEPLEEIISAICDEYTWALPAHNLIKEENIFDPTVIDLNASETGFALAETYYVLGEKLSNDIKNRIKVSLEQKIVKNYESRTFVFDGLHNNWAAVCAAGVGGVYLYLFPERFALVETRIFTTLANYLDSIDEEGYCAEGMGYWAYGFGYFCVFFDVYHNITGKWHPLLDLEKVRNATKYYNNANLGGGEFLPFADGGVRQVKVDPHIIYAVKNLFPNDFVIADELPINAPTRTLGFRSVLGRSKYLPEARVGGDTVFYTNNQVFIHKNKNYSFTAKGGCNHEPHGHLCVGVFQICKDGKRLICDPGAGEYTYAYFKVWDDSYEGRYGEKIFVCSSLAHSVPIVNGKPQPFNLKNDKAELIERTNDCFKIDISKVYGEKLDSLVVTYKMLENSVEVSYECKGVENRVAFRFVSDYQAKIDGESVSIEGMSIENSLGLIPKASVKEYSSHYCEPTNAYLLDYEVAGQKDINITFTFNF